MGGGAGRRTGLAPLGTLAALIALAGVGVLIAQPSTAASPAMVQVIERSIEVRPEGRNRFAAARSGDSVTEGAVIRTDRTGIGEIAFEDGSLTRIGPATTYEIVTLRTEKGRREIIGNLDTGQTFHRVTKVTGSASRFEVQTSDAVAAVRGTAFAVQCTVVDICEFAVTEGTITVRGHDGRQMDVTAGHRVTVDGKGHLGAIKLLSETDPWIARNLAEADSGSAESDTADEGQSTAQFRSWGRFPPSSSNSRSETAAAEPAGDDRAPSEEEARTEQNDGPPDTTSTSETTSTTAGPTTTTTAATTTTTAATTTTAEPPDSTTTSTTSGGEDTTTTTTSTGGEDTTTTTTSTGGEDTTTTTTVGRTPTTPTSEPGTTTTAPCPEGEEHVEGRGCMPECPHDRPRDPNGNCQRECPPGDESEQCRAAASAGAWPSEPKDALPFLWVFSFLFGGAVLAGRAPGRWDD